MSLLSANEIQAQTRHLWATCFSDPDEFLDIYFTEKYTHEANVTCEVGGRVVSAAQILPYRMKLFGQTARVGYLSGMATLPEARGNGHAAKVLQKVHRRLYKEGAVLSYLIPGDEGLRHFYEDYRHGAYWTAAYRKEEELAAMPVDNADISVSEPEEWGTDLFVYYKKATAQIPFMLHPAENDFFAALSACDLAGGHVLVARNKRRIAGLCLAVPEAGGRCAIRELKAAGADERNALLQAACRACGAERAYDRTPQPGTAEGAAPYAMARVTHVEKFLRMVLHAYPELEMHIGIDGDFDVPENNGYYLLRDGKCTLTSEVPADIVTPGGLAALFLAAVPTHIRLMLDE